MIRRGCTVRMKRTSLFEFLHVWGCVSRDQGQQAVSGVQSGLWRSQYDHRGRRGSGRARTAPPIQESGGRCPGQTRESEVTRLCAERTAENVPQTLLLLACRLRSSGRWRWTRTGRSTVGALISEDAGSSLPPTVSGRVT